MGFGKLTFIVIQRRQIEASKACHVSSSNGSYLDRDRSPTNVQTMQLLHGLGCICHGREPGATHTLVNCCMLLAASAKAFTFVPGKQIVSTSAIGWIACTQMHDEYWWCMQPVFRIMHREMIGTAEQIRTAENGQTTRS